METLDLWIKLIGNLGFPIFVALYLLVYHSRLTRELTDAIRNLASVIENWK